MAYTYPGVQYPVIVPEQATFDNSAAGEDARVGGTLFLHTPAQAVLIKGDGFQVQKQQEWNTPALWNQPAAYSYGPISNLVTDPSIDGNSGDARVLGYTLGGVESNLVENFELDGRQGQFPMQAATGYGPVGFADQAGVLGASLAQDAYDFPTPYESGVSIVRDF